MAELKIAEKKKKDEAEQKLAYARAEKLKSVEMEGGGENDLIGSLPSEQGGMNDKVDYSGTDLGGNATSDSSVSFGTKMKLIHEGKDSKQGSGLAVLEENEENGPRCSGRLANKSDIPIMDRAMNLTKSKNLETEGGMSYPTVLNSSDSSIIDMARLIGIDLGASIDMVEYNLGLLREQEHARANIYLENIKKNGLVRQEATNSELGNFETVGVIEEDILYKLLHLDRNDGEELDENFSGHLAQNVAGSGSDNVTRVVHVKTPIKTTFGQGRGKKKRG